MSYLRYVAITIVVLFLGGCAPTHVHKEAKVTPVPVLPKQGFTYHKVEKGETLWRIARNYGVDIETIVESNGLADARSIKVGQMIAIPSAKPETPPDTRRAPVFQKEDFIWPVKGRTITAFGEKRGSTPNKGMDIQAREGSAVVASRSGRVIFSEEKVKGFGKTLILDHGDGFQTVYSHNSQILVNTGEDVKQGQPVAKVGATGRSNAPYLHFEIRKKHKPQNPSYYLP